MDRPIESEMADGPSNHFQSGPADGPSKQMDRPTQTDRQMDRRTQSEMADGPTNPK